MCNIINIGTFETLIEVLKYFIELDKKNGGPSMATRKVKINDIITLLEKPPYSILDKPSWVLRQEKALLGTALSYSTVDTLEVNYSTNTTCKEFYEGKTGKCSIAVELTSVREWTIKNGPSTGNKMGFISVEDSTGSIDCVVFTDVWNKHEAILFEGNTAVIVGERSNKGSFQINQVFQI